jgi:hypothetical protein
MTQLTVEVTPEMVNSILEKQVSEIFQNWIIKDSEYFKRAMTREYQLQFFQNTYARDDLLLEVKEDVEKQAKEAVKKYFKEIVEREMQATFRYTLNNMVRDSLA